jgi:hypothetical protein
MHKSPFPGLFFSLLVDDDICIIIFFFSFSFISFLRLWIIVNVAGRTCLRIGRFPIPRGHGTLGSLIVFNQIFAWKQHVEAGVNRR